ncbi:rhodanese-like domain-containing protein [Thermincola ferriacetica]
MKKRYSAIFLALTLVLCLALAAPAFAETKTMVLKIGNPKFTVGNAVQEVDPGRGTKPVIVKGRTLVPIRAIVEVMGGTVDWAAAEQKVTVRLLDKTVELWIGKTTTTVNGANKNTDVAPQIINGRTMLPARFIAENLGATVGWDPATQSIPITFDRPTDFALIAKAADKALNAPTFAQTINPETLYDAIKKGDKSYFLLSIQSREDYAKGHVPGAINIPFKEIAKKENLAKLPKDKKIVVICYTGHTASYTAMFLNQLGYDATVLKFGTMGWNDKTAGMGTVVPYAGSKGYEVETAPVAATTNELPATKTSTFSVTDTIINATDAFLNSGKAVTISPEALYDAIKKGDKSYFLLSIQTPEDYAKGHVPGAINIPFKAIAKEENLKKLPKDKKIVVICYTGHTASYTSMLLNQLGYDATVLKFGTMGWNDQTAGMGTVKPYAGSKGYEVNTANDFAAIASAADKFLNSPGFVATVNPEDVKANPGKYFLLSIQSAEDYAKGHVPGAVNIPFKQIAKKENLAKLPKDKKIVVICYTGHTASYTAMFLNQLGYDATVLKFGTMGWNDKTPGMGAVKPYAGSKGYEVETKAVGPTVNELPKIITGYEAPEDIIIAATDAFLNSGKPATVNPEDVKTDPSKYFLLSIQTPEDYAKGHVPGAINIPFKAIAKEENLKKLPKDKKIVVICYTGHTASYTSMLLNQLGYDATVLKFGTMGWNDKTPGMGAVKPYAGSKGYEVKQGVNP